MLAPHLNDSVVSRPAGRLDNLTGLRAFAAVWVMLGHFSGDTGVAPFLRLGPVIERGAFGVDVFFVLSGFVITLSSLATLKADRPFGWQFRDYLARRFARIYPLHLATFLLVATLVGIAVDRHYHFTADVSYSPLAAVLNLLLIHSWALLDRPSWNTVSWSLSAEWFAYLLIFPACVYLLERLTTVRLVLLVVVSWLLFAGTTLFIEHRGITNVTHDGIFRVIPEFIAGYLLCRISPIRVPRWGGLLTGLGCLAFWPIATLSGAYELAVLPAALAILLGLLQGGRVVSLLFGNPVSVFLGEASFAIYLVHPFIRTVGDQLLRRRTEWVAPENAVIVLVLEVAATLALAIAVYRWVEIPSRRGTLAMLRRWVGPALTTPHPGIPQL
jgi:peptidoglycan/LPS O-acetylase OafA/YrhL